jgi:hypothetical protein
MKFRFILIMLGFIVTIVLLTELRFMVLVVREILWDWQMGELK